MNHEPQKLMDRKIAEEVERSQWHGILNLGYANQNGKTQVTDSYAKAPLKIQRPFYPEAEAVSYTHLTLPTTSRV